MPVRPADRSHPTAPAKPPTGKAQDKAARNPNSRPRSAALRGRSGKRISLRRCVRSSKGERTAEAIVRAAFALFVQKGYHATSMRQIAKQVGLAPGGLYNHFASKEALFAAVLDAYHPYRRLLPAIEAAEGETVEEFVRDAAQRAYQILSESEAEILPLALIELIEFQGQHLARLVETVFPKLLGFAQRFSARRGQVRPVPVPVALRTFVGLILSFMLTEMVVGKVPALRSMDHDWFGGMLDIYLYGLLAGPALPGQAGGG